MNDKGENMNKIKVNRKFTGYGVIDDKKKYEKIKKMNADRDALKDKK